MNTIGIIALFMDNPDFKRKYNLLWALATAAAATTDLASCKRFLKNERNYFFEQLFKFSSEITKRVFGALKNNFEQE